MAIQPLDYFVSNVPGVLVYEDTFGNIPQGIAPHNQVYWLVFSTQAGAPVEELTFVQSYEDFVNVFGATSSNAAIELFFKQRPGNGIYVINVKQRTVRTLTVPTATPAAVYTVTIGGFAVSYTAPTGATTGSILTELTQKFNQTVPHLGRIVDGKIRTFDSATTVTVSGNLTLGTAGTVPAYPVAQDVVDALYRVINSDLTQGFILAPEFFQEFTSSPELSTLAYGMEAVASDPKHNMVAIADCSEATATSVTGGGAVNLALTERSNLTSPRGHLWYYFPYLVLSDDTLVPSSAAVVGIALSRMRSEGYRQPAAGTSYPVRGVVGTSFKVTDVIQEQLNPQGINCLRTIRNKGTVVYGARTLSTSAFYKFGPTRIIFNVLARTIQDALDNLVFQSIDGQGAVFTRVKGTCAGICERLRVSGALFGATPSEAYLVVCDRTNNPSVDLDNGRLLVDVYAKPSPIAEMIGVRLYRTALSTDLNSEVTYDRA